MLLATFMWAGLSLLASPFPNLALLQNMPTMVLVAAGAWLLPRWPLSSRSLLCVCAFLWLHTLGGRYAYSFVPYDRWSADLFGLNVTDLFGFKRNHFDRLVHFSFGLLSVAPLLEILRRYLRVPPRASLYLVAEFVLAISALYELFEWLLTVAAAGPAANEYNGQQGDIWDAQKDMAMALTGALASLSVSILRRARREAA